MSLRHFCQHEYHQLCCQWDDDMGDQTFGLSKKIFFMTKPKMYASKFPKALELTDLVNCKTCIPQHKTQLSSSNSNIKQYKQYKQSRYTDTAKPSLGDQLLACIDKLSLSVRKWRLPSHKVENSVNDAKKYLDCMNWSDVLQLKSLISHMIMSWYTWVVQEMKLQQSSCMMPLNMLSIDKNVLLQQIQQCTSH